VSPHHRRDPGLAPGLAARLDPLCDEFEAEWLAGRRPRIEDYLLRAEGVDRAALLRELLAVEVEHRRKRGETPTADDYRPRFPHDNLSIPTVPASAPTPPAPSDSSATASPGPTRRDAPVPRPPVPRRYELRKLLGQGGMGDVWLGRDRRLRRLVAVKVVQRRWADYENVLRRFAEEAQLTSQLQHPGIPPVYETGALPDGRPYFCMKVVRGRTLASLRARRASPADDRPRLLGVFEQVCQAVAYAHSKGVIHRDLKPHNVMVGAFGEVQVMD
jgi:hypothetical protein